MLSSTPTHPERGSALFVTIMITSVALLFAMILLERIIPYSKQIRGMQNSLQAYYTARGEVEMARHDFLSATARANIDTDGRIDDAGGAEIVVELPTFSDDVTGKHVVVSNHTNLPLQIKLFGTDESSQGFGTSQKNPAFHTLSSYGGGMLLDFSGQDTTSLSMTIHTEGAAPAGKMEIEFVYSDSSETVSFFGTIMAEDGSDIVNAVDSNKLAGSNKLSDLLLPPKNCTTAGASCAMKLRLSNPSTGNLPVSFSFSPPVPDLNAIIIADGLSDSGDYHTRIIELIPLTQSI